MAGDFSQKLSNHFHLWTGCDLDGLSLHSTRNRNGDFHPVGHRGVGNAARFRAIRERNGKSVAAGSAIVDRRPDDNGDGAFRRYGGATAY